MPFVFVLLLLIGWKKKKQQKKKGRTTMAVISGVRRQTECYVRRKVSATEKVPNETTPGHYGKNELDTHADTCCAGKNWRLLEYTGESCQVSPFLNTYETTKDIPVTKCGTVWTSVTDGREYLLIGDQMLWFGKQLEHSLLNPNQMQMYGLSVCDDPWDEHRALGIDFGETFIPFETEATNVMFETRVLTNEEIDDLPKLYLTGPEWNPANI